MTTTEGSSRAPGGRNRLADEHSPYLLQHADNPVDWYPWGEEAFDAARARDKPIWLSIGYATCHWCHVMAHESFEDEAVAARMNDAFVNIKVDREERPDIDAVYMRVCQMIGQSCGWPLNVVMTPDGEPFLAVTYVPRDARFGRKGMLELVPDIEAAWRTRRGELMSAAREVTDRLAQTAGAAAGPELGATALSAAYAGLAERFDAQHGGFGGAPKFPTPHNLLFLLRRWRRTGDRHALEMTETTLRAMRRGGVYDHVGFGFHRYATDRLWKLPHFEKMLYDQALLLTAYAEAHLATGNETYADVVREVVAYVRRDLTAPEGAFYSAEDADSEGEEGKFYVWTLDELREALGPADAALAAAWFGATSEGNFEDEATRERTGANVLHVSIDAAALAEREGMSEAELGARLASIRARLLEARSRRARPLLDDKILTDWNGLMIGGLAVAGRALGEPSFADDAARAAAFLLEHMRRGDGRLVHRYRDGQAGIDATLDDYAFLSWGLIELYQTTFETPWLEAAISLTDMSLAHFWDEDEGGFFLTADDGESLVVRPKETYDGAVPSGNSVAMSNLLRLARLTGNARYERVADELGRAFAGFVSRVPAGHTFMMTAVDLALGPSFEVVVAGDTGGDDTQAFVQALHGAYVPHVTTVVRDTSAETPPIDALAPFVADHRPVDGRAAAYACQDFTCQAPTTDPRELLREVLGG